MYLHAYQLLPVIYAIQELSFCPFAFIAESLGLLTLSR
jgi:hypothetical protein